MAEKTGIAWCHHTKNFWEGCTKVSPGCTNCYAEARDKRFNHGVHWGPGAARLPHLVGALRDLPRWNRAAYEARERRRVFVNSLSDFFDNDVPPIWRWLAWRTIQECRHLDFLLLTKRIGNVLAMLPPDWGFGYGNVWLGITVVNQEEVDRDIPKLRAVPAYVRFLSCEPLLEKIDLCETFGIWWNSTALRWERQGFHSGIDWVIVGGESGRGARPFSLTWARSLREQCAAANVAFFMKQLGSNPELFGHAKQRAKWDDPDEWPAELQVQEFPA